MLALLLTVLDGLGVPLLELARAWARLLPTVTLLPALGARFLPMQARVVLGLSLAGLLWPAVGEIANSGAGDSETGGLQVSVVWLLLSEVLRGLPVALSAAASLWGVSLAGALFDDLRGGANGQLNLVSDASSPFGTLLSLFASLGFLELGGVEQVVAALASSPFSQGAPYSHAAEWGGAIVQVNAGIYAAFALMTPLLVVSLLADVASGLAARAANPAAIQGIFAPLRSVLLLAALALVWRNGMNWVSGHLLWVR